MSSNVIIVLGLFKIVFRNKTTRLLSLRTVHTSDIDKCNTDIINFLLKKDEGPSKHCKCILKRLAFHGRDTKRRSPFIVTMNDYCRYTFSRISCSEIKFIHIKSAQVKNLRLYRVVC